MKKHILVALTLALASQAHAAGAGARAVDDMDPDLLRALALSTAAAEATEAEEAALHAALRASAEHPDRALSNFNNRLHDRKAIEDFAKLTHGLSADDVHQLINLIQSCYSTASANELHTLIHPLSNFDVESMGAELRTELYTLLLTTPEQAAWGTMLQNFAADNGLDAMKFFHIDEEGTAAAAAAIDREKAATATAIDHEIEGMDPILRNVLHTLLLNTEDQSQWGNIIKEFVDTNDLAVSRFFAEANDTAIRAVVTALQRKAAEEAAAEATRIEALREALARRAHAVAHEGAGVPAAAFPAARAYGMGGGAYAVAPRLASPAYAPGYAAAFPAARAYGMGGGAYAVDPHLASPAYAPGYPAAFPAAPQAAVVAPAAAIALAADATIDPSRARAALIAAATRKRMDAAEAARAAAVRAAEERAAANAAAHAAEEEA